jgi:hypothetical protein
MRNLSFLFLFLFSFSLAQGQEEEPATDAQQIATNPFWDNWYGQVSVDMNLLFPKGHSLRNVFPNGKSMGVNVAFGKWFSPEFGGRLKLNWGNGILKNDHNTWLRPYGVPGGNHRKGGFITFIGDIDFNLHNLFGEYRPDRKWNLIFAPRAGGWIHIDEAEGAPILGIAVKNTYQLTDKCRLFADVGYHFISSVNGVDSGTGHGSNAYGDINVGVEMDLSNNIFHVLPKGRKGSGDESVDPKATVLNPVWDNWFVQVGLGMSLINPYETNFADVFPNGKTFGINLGIGKWFAPEAGLRAGMNWQNGIVVNHHATYLQPREDSQGDPDKHGFVALYADMLLNLHNAVAGYDESRKWNTIIFPRMGLAWNRSSEYKECPILGLGTEQTYQINDRIKLFADVAYQVTTGGFLDKKFYTDATGTNGWFDINVGVAYNLGNNKWKKAK